MRIPDSVAAAVIHAAAGGRVMAGGTIVMAQVNHGTAAASELVSLRRAGVSGIAVEGTHVSVGATTTLAEVEESTDLAFLRAAVRTIASPTIRTLATVGGNLFVPQPYGDLAVCLLALDATVNITGPDGDRTAPVERLRLDRGEIVTAVRFAVPAAGTWFYHKAMRRRLNSAAIVAVAAVVETADGPAGRTVTSARIALGGVAPRPVRAGSAETVLIGRPLETDVLDEAGRAARADIDPFDDSYASAWYRSRVLPVHLRRAFIG
ncbi:FAD binding domain-containing protein [Virgisporangium aurantiacum]|uniref:FAD binding domain-containing protein n=1 Tax=Virgisporangium aurantiacum TaxID=175570 RepID=UPI0019504BF1|nr:FAD binding domain-containing protein [Virgisporangium aurantiacum]